MRRLIILVFSILFSVSMTGCTSGRGSAANNMSNSSDLTVSSSMSASTSIPSCNNAAIRSNIPTNASVNVAWGGGMCEANGYVYYVSARDPQETIIRMNQDGSNPAVVSDGYYYIGNLTADSHNLYFASRSESNQIYTIYSLPLDGGIAQKVTEGYIRELQTVNGRLYWEEYNTPTGVVSNDTTTSLQIKSVNPDGSDLKTLIDLKASAINEGPFNFVATDSGIYYSKSRVSTSDYTIYSDVYHTDLSGNNSVKLNHDPLRCIYNIYCDQGNIYFLVENDFSADRFSSSLVTLDKTGKTQIVLKHVDYFSQDFACLAYCGISDSIIYYFVFQQTNGSSANILMALHQYNISTNKDEVLLSGVDMGDSAVGTIASIHGKSIKGDSIGMYILGNDIYFEPFQMP